MISDIDSATNRVELLLIEDSPKGLAMPLSCWRKKTSPTNRIAVTREGAKRLQLIFCEDTRTALDITAGLKLVLLDLKLPKVDGSEVLSRLKAAPHTRVIAVIVLTSPKQQINLIESFRPGLNTYLVNTTDFERFAAAAHELERYWLQLPGRASSPGRSYPTKISDLPGPLSATFR